MPAEEEIRTDGRDAAAEEFERIYPGQKRPGHYLIEAEREEGITKKQLERIDALPEERFLGSFDVMEKMP